MSEKLNWNPIRKGNVYCSSACGRKCTIDEYNAIVKSGNELRDMVGDGWTVETWENYGWHSRVERGNASISKHCNQGSADSYTLIINWQCSSIVIHGDDPRELIKQALSNMIEQTDKAVSQFNEINHE